MFIYIYTGRCRSVLKRPQPQAFCVLQSQLHSKIFVPHVEAGSYRSRLIGEYSPGANPQAHRGSSKQAAIVGGVAQVSVDLQS
jgi:hypothetical protein